MATPTEPKVIVRRDLERRLGEEIPRILAETALVPVTQEGRIVGFTVNRLPPQSLLTEVGLQPGDVVTEINGTAVDSMATLIGLYGRLQSETAIRAVVLRGGAPVRLGLDLR